MSEEITEKIPELSWYDLAKERAQATIELIKSYKKTNDKARNGEKITAADFQIPEKIYLQQIEDIKGKGDKLLKDPDNMNLEENKLHNNAWEESLKLVEDWKKENSQIMESISNSEPLIDAFRRQYLNLSDAPPKNLSISADVKTQNEFITELLAKNTGVAVGDIHTRSAALPFIYENMATFKKSGVDTIYLELDTTTFSYLNNLSIKELQAKLDSRTPEIIKQESIATAMFYQTNQSDDITGQYIHLLLEAKKNGIEVVNIDKEENVRIFEENLSKKHRISSTNYTWSESIIADRENKPKDGKYIALGGVFHFASRKKTKGLVDERLGIPSIAFDNRDKNTESPILRGSSPNAADFYLPAGECYPDTKAPAIAADWHDKARQSQPHIAKQFEKFANENMEQFIISTQLVCTTAQEADNKHPTPISVASQNLEKGLNK